MCRLATCVEKLCSSLIRADYHYAVYLFYAYANVHMKQVQLAEEVEQDIRNHSPVDI